MKNTRLINILFATLAVAMAVASCTDRIKPENESLTMSKVRCTGATPYSLTFEWDKVEGALLYTIGINGKEIQQFETIYTATALIPDTEYTISVKAVSYADGHVYSNEETCTARTTVKGTDPDPDPNPGPDPDPDPDPDPIQTGVPAWYELPDVEVTKSGNYLVDKDNSDYYYAFHTFSYTGGKARNFSVCYSASNHGPMWIAAPRHAFYHGGSLSGRNYKKDPSIPAEIQIDASGGNTFNKGHMLGRAERDKWSEAHSQVSYLTNIAPQHATTFNTGGGAWNNLEDFVDDFECADTMYQVVGAYYQTYVDSYGTNQAKIIQWGGGNISYPTMFYYAMLRTKSGNTHKALKNCSASELQCVAFVMSHAMAKGHKPCAKDMMSISDLEKLTGFTYFTNVPNAPKDSFTPSDWGL